MRAHLVCNVCSSVACCAARWPSRATRCTRTCRGSTAASPPRTCPCCRCPRASIRSSPASEYLYLKRICRKLLGISTLKKDYIAVFFYLRLLAKAGVKVSPEQLRARASPTGPRRSDIKLDAKSAASENSSLCGDNDDDLSQSKYQDSIPVSPPRKCCFLQTTLEARVILFNYLIRPHTIALREREITSEKLWVKKKGQENY